MLTGSGPGFVAPEASEVVFGSVRPPVQHQPKIVGHLVTHFYCLGEILHVLSQRIGRGGKHIGVPARDLHFNN